MVEISDLSNETSGTSFAELLRKKFPRLEDPSETKINPKLNFLLSVRTFFVSKGKYQRNCRPVASYFIFVQLTLGKITRYAQTDFALAVCSLTTIKILRNGRGGFYTLQVSITFLM
jgi:hypothetical protein